MAVDRIPWALAARGDRLEPCLLIAGYPHPITPAGVALTDVVWTDDPDTAWHVGTTGITPKGWLDVPTGRDDDPPDLVVSEKLSPVRGTIDVEPVRVSLTDPAGAVSTLTANRNELPATPIAATLAAASTGPLTVMSTDGFASSGDLYLGREVIAYTGKTSTTFTGLTRAQHGTTAQDHRLISSQVRPSAFGNPSGAVSLPSLLGRRVTLWLLRFTGATTATNPSLVFDGRVGPGASLRGAGWSIPVVHALAALSQEVRAVPLTFSGYHHLGTFRRGSTVLTPDVVTPLWVRWNGRNALLNGDDNSIDARGWHASPTAYLDAFRRAIADAGMGSEVRVSAAPDGSVLVNANAGSSSILVVGAWGSYYESARDTVAAHRTPPMPPAYVRLAGAVHLTAGEIGQVPTPPAPLPDAPVDMAARYAVVVGEDDERQVSTIESIGTEAVTLRPLTGDGAILEEPSGATVGVSVTYSNWWQAWRFGVLPMVDNIQATNGVTDSFDWDRITVMARRSPSSLPLARQYLFVAGDDLLEALTNELRLSGLTLSTWRGRIACVRSAEVAATEPLAAQIPKADLLDGDPAVVEVGDGLATVFSLTLPGVGTVRVVDAAAEAEHGAGETIAVNAAAVYTRETLSLAAIWDDVGRAGMTVIGPHRRPYRVATVRLPASYVGVELGDVVTLTEWLLPTGSGGRGLAGVPCVVVGRRFNVTAATIELDLRLSAPELAGYAPEALVSSISGAALTIDTTFLGAGSQGPHGFADDENADGTVRADGGTSTFIAGDEVQLIELDTATPAAPFRATVLSAASTTVTLDASPGGSWATLAATPGKVMLAFAPYADATAAQRRYCYLADASTHLINATTRARRYAP